MLFCDEANEIQQTQIEKALATPAESFCLGSASYVLTMYLWKYLV